MDAERGVAPEYAELSTPCLPINRFPKRRAAGDIDANRAAGVLKGVPGVRVRGVGVCLLSWSFFFLTICSWTFRVS